MRTIKVTNLKEMADVLGLPLNNELTVTDLDDIDDTMDLETAKIGLVGAITPELPQRNFNIRTLTQVKLEELKKSSN